MVAGKAYSQPLLTVHCVEDEGWKKEHVGHSLINPILFKSTKMMIFKVIFKMFKKIHEGH